MDSLHIIKIGGNIIDDNPGLSSFLKTFALLPGKKILVHGGGKVATKIGEKMGIASKYADGRRITDEETIDLVTMVYAGLLNKKITARLQASRCNAMGICGADGNLIPARKRPVTDIDYGFVGDVDSNALRIKDWQLFLDGNLVPVVAPLTHDGQGQLLNTNADTIARELAQLLSGSYQVNLIYLFEKNGVLLNTADENSVIPRLTPAYYHELREAGKVTEGMIPKLDNAFAALQEGVNKVIIGNAESIPELLTGKSGTTIIDE